MSNRTTANIVEGVWRLKIQNYLAIANPGILVGNKGKVKKKHTHTLTRSNRQLTIKDYGWPEMKAWWFMMQRL